MEDILQMIVAVGFTKFWLSVTAGLYLTAAIVCIGKRIAR